MRAVTLHAVERAAALFVAAPGRAPDERVVVWSGLPPPVIAAHRGIASVVLEGRIDGRLSYAEQVPVGVRAAAHPIPSALRGYVAARVVAALRFLHELGEVHGAVGLDRVALGERGEVVLFGRGRRGGSPRLDLVASLAIAGTAPDGLDEAALEARLYDLGAEAPGDAASRLGEWVRAQPPPTPGVETVVLILDEDGDAVDEIVPDLGPDRGEGGILERWAVTTHPGRTPADVTEEVSSTAPVMGVTLWNRLAAPRPEAPPDRFDTVDGQPSRALRALLAEDAPDVLPGPLVGPLPPFVFAAAQFDDQPTVVGVAPPDTGAPAPARSVPPPRGVPWVQWLLAMGLGGALMWVALRLLA